jgi:hypothetical protein
MRGVLISNPGAIFDNSPNFIPVNWPQTAFQFGARQQVYFQSVDPQDRGGTAMFMAQSLGNHPANQDDFFSYTNAAWIDELLRINTDSETGHVFAAGDLVEVRARTGLHFSGKFNINEAHDNSPANDFDVILVEAGYGLPTPQPIVLADIKDSDNADIFDPTRHTGGERYQSQLVELRGVTIIDPENWGTEMQITVADGERTLPVLLGTDPAFDSDPIPVGPLDIVGVFDQEASVQPFGGLDGYRLIATSRADFSASVSCVGDLNGDLQTDAADWALFAAAFASTNVAADLDDSGLVDLADYAVLQVHAGCGVE